MIETECKHCGQAMRIGVDSDMQISFHDYKNKPWVFMPEVDWNGFTGRTIIDAY